MSMLVDIGIMILFFFVAYETSRNYSIRFKNHSERLKADKETSNSANNSLDKEEIDDVSS